MQQPSQVMVFIDYQNAHLSALEAFYPRGTRRSFGHINPRRLGELVVAKRNRNGLSSELAGVRVYRGRPETTRDPTGATANDRQAEAWSRLRGVTIIRRPLRYPSGWPRTPAQEKGIDVALAVDLVSLAFVGDYDVGIVMSSDTDLLPAIEAVTDVTRARVEVAAWRRRPRLSFTDDRKLWCHWIDQDEYRSIEDLTNYTKPSGRSGP